MDAFPRLKARNLEGRAYQLPGDLDGELNVVIIAFQRWHQDLVDTWVPWLERLEAERPSVRFYELPTLSNMYSMARGFIDGGMAAGIPSPAARERTLTVYTDVRQALAAWRISDNRTIWTMLVDKQGRILWRGEGPYSAPAATSLLDAIDAGLGLDTAAGAAINRVR